MVLRWLCGLSVEQIARAQERTASAVVSRLERAHTVVERAEISNRAAVECDLDCVLRVVCSIFGEADASFGGELLVRGEWQHEGIQLARLLSQLLPESDDVWSLLAWMLLLDSRRAARFSDEGELLILDEQDRTLWNREQITEGLACLERALSLGTFSTFALQASVAALHASSPSASKTNRGLISAVHGSMLLRGRCFAHAISYADAVSRAEGPRRGLSVLAGLGAYPNTVGRHRFHALRGEMLARLGQRTAATREYRAALEVVRSDPERRYLTRRLRELTN